MARHTCYVLVLLGIAGCAVASSTNTIQLTDSGHCDKAIFSPDGTYVVYAEHDVVLPAAENDGMAITAVNVRLWRDGKATDLVRLEPGKATARGETVWKQPWVEMAWLADGNWLLVCDQVLSHGGGDQEGGYGGTLVRMADGWSTRVGASGDWYVANDPVDLDRKTEKELNRRLRWGRDDSPLDRLREKLPERSRDYLYHWTDVSPDGRYVVGIFYDAHFDGCACSEGMQQAFVGRWDARRNTCMRLTSSENGSAGSPSFSPDGKYIAYIMRDFHSVDKAAEWAHLRLLTLDGKVRRRLAPESDYVGAAQWLGAKRLLYKYAVGRERVRPETHSGAEWHLAVLDVETGERRGLTKGHFQHELLDHQGGRFLVAERDLEAEPYEPTADLYIIELPEDDVADVAVP